MKSITLVSFILIVTLTACSSPVVQNTPSGILFADDFSTTGMDWSQYTDSTYSTDYFNNAYRILVNDTGVDVWSNPGRESFTDVQIEVDATMNGGPEDNSFGVICRYINDDQFYYALISSDGYYGIMKMTDGGGLIVGEEYLLESDKIAQGTNTNHIRFDCVGTELTLYVNGYLLGKQSDSDYPTGNVGIIAGSYKTAGTDVLFDNYFVYKP